MKFRLLVALFIASFSILVEADERILKFHSDIVINADGSVDVVETITVRAENRKIRRGIYRDFPTDYEDRLGNRVRVGFDLEFVRRDSRSENYRTERLANGVRVYAGRNDYVLPSGVYEYEIGYRVTQMLGFFEHHDELYWNVTGNGWEFPIDEASASVRLPESIQRDDIKAHAFTGLFGSKEQSFSSNVAANATVTINATRKLGPREGMTITVAWPKDVITPPTKLERVQFLLSQNRGLFWSLAATLFSLGMLFVSWLRVGRDPAPGVIMPLYEPPPDVSPASLRYIAKMRYDKGVLSAATLNLAVKGFLTIKESGGDYTLKRTDKPADETLAPGEAVLLSKYFINSTSLKLEDDNHVEIGAAKKAHQRTLYRYHHKRFFLDNVIHLVPPIAIIAIAFLVTWYTKELYTATKIVFGIAAIGVGIFWWLLKTPTPLGRQLLDKVDGFRMYLEFAEKDEMNFKNPPEETPELFERYLPYALALDVEQPWAERFASVFREFSDTNGDQYHPDWYSGRFNRSNPVHFANAVGDSFGKAISSASTPPGSSSGGGGFSGGGGGGGGGGGW